MDKEDTEKKENREESEKGKNTERCSEWFRQLLIQGTIRGNLRPCDEPLLKMPKLPGEETAIDPYPKPRKDSPLN